MPGDFLGVGWTTPVRLNAEGQVDLAQEEAAVRQSIWMILSTAPGERLMRPDFGCGIHEFVFASMSGETIGEVMSAVSNALITWEPRIDLEAVDVFPDPQQSSQLLIQIHYRVRTTNNRFNLVYPFYLE
ncbi:GPW/gp25 family protein [Cyanobacteria bacterium FACHB-DQ100]|uniref:GPW/gp25 family protein n=1 Tax=unclassified Leptolyngbya TaxID=2650499 RepID=UPI001680EE06|nr:GPW/gp25 family protein [Leptolyngbya sp. FACHB-17]MBD1823544.1 GPW/gp25 family protein [Cyanobacteria bacterium FACHB-DQ100]MBD2080292.1 GPW/gp25 family protein [Leptolyngbya sp. FACHB-17]